MDKLFILTRVEDDIVTHQFFDNYEAAEDAVVVQVSAWASEKISDRCHIQLNAEWHEISESINEWDGNNRIHILLDNALDLDSCACISDACYVRLADRDGYNCIWDISAYEISADGKYEPLDQPALQ